MATSAISQTQNLHALSKTVESEIQYYLESLKTRGIDPPSLSLKRPEESPLQPETTQPEVEQSKRAIVHACEKIIALVQGPPLWLWMETTGHITTAAMSIVLALKVNHHVSLDPSQPTNLEELAETTGGSRELLRRVLRYLTQRFIFEEIAPGQYIHNAVSKVLTQPVAEASATIGTLDLHRAFPALVDVLKENKFQIPESSRKSAFSKAFQTDLNLFDFLREKDPELGKRFALSMSGRISGPHQLYNYAALPAGATLVDVAGGSGHVCVDLARKYSHLCFIVQDYEDIVDYGESTYATNTQRLSIEWQAHDVFDPQPVKGADLYLLRHLLVDCPDGEAVQVLRHTADAMCDKSRILIVDGILPVEYGEDSGRMLNTIDLHLLSIFNSKERTLDQWKSLVESADKGLEIVRTWTDGKGGADGQAILEIRLDAKN